MASQNLKGRAGPHAPVSEGSLAEFLHDHADRAENREELKQIEKDRLFLRFTSRGVGPVLCMRHVNHLLSGCCKCDCKAIRDAKSSVFHRGLSAVENLTPTQGRASCL